MEPLPASRGSGCSNLAEREIKVSETCTHKVANPAPMLQNWLDESFQDGPFHNIGAVANGSKNV
jgi:hypothetical protein